MATADNITTLAGRRALAPRNEPYWTPLGTPGAYLGFRKMGAAKTSTEGIWRVRLYGDRADGSRGQTYESLPAAVDHNDAVKLARAWVEQREAGVADTGMTVAGACARYAKIVEAGDHEKPARPDTAKAWRGSYARWIDNDKLGRVKLENLKEEHLRDWRARMAATPVRGGGKRSKGVMNLDMTALRAALNHALAGKLIATDVWKLPLAPFRNAHAVRSTFYDKAERRALLAKMGPELQRFCSAMLMVPLRPGALAALTVADFDPKTSTLCVPKDKVNGGRRIHLPKATAAFFASLRQDGKVTRLPKAPLLVDPAGAAWTKETWVPQFKAAVLEAGLDPKGTMYVLRHCAITDLVLAGLPLAKVAHVAGTSVAMIERHYSKIQPGDVTDALEVLAAAM